MAKHRFWTELDKESQQWRVELAIKRFIAHLRRQELRSARRLGEEARRLIKTESSILGGTWDEIRYDILYRADRFFDEAPDDEIFETVEEAQAIYTIIFVAFAESLRQQSIRLFFPLAFTLLIMIYLLQILGFQDLAGISLQACTLAIVLGSFGFRFLLSKFRMTKKGSPPLPQLGHREYKEFAKRFESYGLTEEQKKIKKLISDFTKIRDDLFRDVQSLPLDSADVFDRFIDTFSELSQAFGNLRLQELTRQMRGLRADLARRVKNDPSNAKELIRDFGRIMSPLLLEVAVELNKPESDT